MNFETTPGISTQEVGKQGGSYEANELFNRTKVKFMKLGTVLKAAALLLLLGGTIFGYRHFTSPKGVMKRWLGVPLPPDSSDVRYFGKQLPGYQWVILMSRFKLPRQSLDAFTSRLGMHKAEPNDGSFLPTNLTGGLSVDWWTPPAAENQKDRFVR